MTARQFCIGLHIVYMLRGPKDGQMHGYNTNQSLGEDMKNIGICKEVSKSKQFYVQGGKIT